MQQSEHHATDLSCLGKIIHFYNAPVITFIYSCVSIVGSVTVIKFVNLLLIVIYFMTLELYGVKVT